MQSNDEKITYGGCWNDGDREAYEKWFMQARNEWVDKILLPEVGGVFTLEFKLRLLACVYRKHYKLTYGEISNKFRLKNQEAARSICRQC